MKIKSKGFVRTLVFGTILSGGITLIQPFNGKAQQTVPGSGGETLKTCSVVDENGFFERYGGICVGSVNFFGDYHICG
jgi:hypothetical protein